MSLYGNIKKIGSASFQFDRKYNNRAEMDASAATDGVYAGRYVLVEYGNRFGIDGSDITSTEEGTGISQFPDGYKLVNTPDGAIRVEGVVENSAFKQNANTDLMQYGAVYDSTVWQKIYINKNGVGVDKYIMVAELNAMAPKMDILQDSPLQYEAANQEIPNYRTEGIVTGKLNENGQLIETVRLINAEEIYNKAHFDTALDTELTYLLHLPTALNLELDNKTIDFNEKGFNIVYSYPESDGVSTIAWIPKGHDEDGNPIYLDNYTIETDGSVDNGGNPFATLRSGSYPMDTKMLFMSFPALGNLMNGLYNLIYGKPDPNDDITHGAMRPYFKRFLEGLELENKIIVYDDQGNDYYVQLTQNGTTDFVRTRGTVDGRRVTPIFNRSELDGEIYPSFIVARYHDEAEDIYIDFNQTNEQSPYVLYNTLTNQYISTVIHIPSGDDDPKMTWLSQVPALSDILSNNDTGLATVLSSLFGTVDPLTGTTKYYLYNDWTASTEDGSSGPAISNKPKIVGGYEEIFNFVHAGESAYNILGRRIHETPGYFWNYSSPSIETIPYPHTEYSQSKEFSGGHYTIDFTTWQMIDYSIPNINYYIDIFRPGVTIDSTNSIFANQGIIELDEHTGAIVFTSTMELFESTKGNIEGKWVCFDLDTGFSSIVGLTLDNGDDGGSITFTDEDEDEFDNYGLKQGHALVWALVHDEDGYNKTFTLQAAGFNNAVFSITYGGIVSS